MKKKIRLAIILNMIGLLFLAQTSSFADQRQHAAYRGNALPTTPHIPTSSSFHTTPVTPTVTNEMHHTLAPPPIAHRIDTPAMHAATPSAQPRAAALAQHQQMSPAKQTWTHREVKGHDQHGAFFSTLLYPANFVPAYIISGGADDSSYADYNYTENAAAVASDNNYPLPANEAWVDAANGNVPDNAITYQSRNGDPTFYCLVQADNVNYYGELIPNDGCYITDNGESYEVSQYQALVRTN